MIFNTTSPSSTSEVSIPNTIYIGYDITRNYSNWKDPVIRYESTSLISRGVQDTQYTAQVWERYSFSSSDGTFSTSGKGPNYRLTSIPSGGIAVDGWMISSTPHTIYHINRITKVEEIGSVPTTYRLNYDSDRQAISTQNCTITYNSITSVSLSPRSGDEWKAVSLYK